MTEFRKIIGFGKSSFVVSLPKHWVQKNKLKKGDVVSLIEHDDRLELTLDVTEKKTYDYPVRININGKNMRDVKREIISHYIGGCTSFTIKGDLKSYAKDIRDVMHNLMALEIVEQTGDTLVAKDFIDITQVNIDQMIRKIDVMIKCMLVDLKEEIDQLDYESLILRDSDVNKIAFLLFRTIRINLLNPALMSKSGLNSLDLLSKWWIITFMERVGDDIKDIARYMKRMDIKKVQLKELVGILDNIEISYKTTMSSYYKGDSMGALKIAQNKYLSVDRALELSKKYHGRDLWPNLMEKIINLVLDVHELGRRIYC